MALSFPPPFRLDDQNITPAVAASRPREAEAKIWLYWMQYGVMPPAFPCGIFFHGGVFNPPFGTDVRIPDDWERRLTQTPEEWYDHTRTAESWRTDPLMSQRAQRREDYAQAMLHNDIDPVRTHWYGQPPPTGGRFVVGHPSPPRDAHRRGPSFHGAYTVMFTPSTPSKAGKSRTQTIHHAAPPRVVTNSSPLAAVPEIGSSGAQHGSLSSFSVNSRGHRKTQSTAYVASFMDACSPGSFQARLQTPTRIPAPTLEHPSTITFQGDARSPSTASPSSAFSSSPAAHTSSSSATTPSPLSLRQWPRQRGASSAAASSELEERVRQVIAFAIADTDTEHDSSLASPTPASQERFPRIVGRAQYDFDDETMSPFAGSSTSRSTADRSHTATMAQVGGSARTNDSTGSASSDTSDSPAIHNNIRSTSSDTSDRNSDRMSATPPPSDMDVREAENRDLYADPSPPVRSGGDSALRVRTLIECEYGEAWCEFVAETTMGLEETGDV